jgi:hypothetical protein
LNAFIAICVGLLFLALQFWKYRQAKSSVQSRCTQWARSCSDGKRRGQTRESAVLDLERSLAGNPDMSFLRRLGVIAPLIGVALTAVSVLSLGFGGSSAALQTTLLESSNVAIVAAGIINPLFWGVSVGAVLAILNQLFLHHATKFEDTCFAECIDPARASGFRDTDDRLDALIKQFDEAALRLGQSADIVGNMLKTARAAMEGMNEACNEAATSLGGISVNLNEALRAPTKDFVDAAAGMRKTALDAAKQFSTGITALSKQTTTVEQRIGAALERNAEVVDAQAKSADAVAKAAQLLQSRVGQMPADAFSTLASQVRTAEAALGELHAGVTEISGKLPASIAKFTDAMASESDRAVDQIKALPALLTPATEGLTTGADRISTALAAIGERADSTRAALERLNALFDTRGQLEQTFRSDIEATSQAIRGLESRTSQLPLEQLATRASDVQSRLASLAETLASVTASMEAHAQRLHREATAPAAIRSQVYRAAEQEPFDRGTSMGEPRDTSIEAKP